MDIIHIEFEKYVGFRNYFGKNKILGYASVTLEDASIKNGLKLTIDNIKLLEGKYHRISIVLPHIDNIDFDSSEEYIKERVLNFYELNYTKLDRDKADKLIRNEFSRLQKRYGVTFSTVEYIYRYCTSGKINRIEATEQNLRLYGNSGTYMTI